VTASVSDSLSVGVAGGAGAAVWPGAAPAATRPSMKGINLILVILFTESSPRPSHSGSTTGRR